MTRRGGLMTAATAATLILTAWVSAAGPIGIFARPDLSTFHAKAPGEEYGTSAVSPGQRGVGRTSDASQANDTLVQFIDAALKVVVALIVVAVLLAIGRGLLRRWQARAEHAHDEEAGYDTVPAAILRQARASEELLAQGTPGNAVIAAWVGLEDAVRSAGVREDSARTSAELVTVVLRNMSVDRSALDELAALYREARFSRHVVTEPMRQRAGDALRRVQTDLARHLQATAQGGARS